MTVVIEGRMSNQFYLRGADGLVPDGDRVFLNKGDCGYVKAGRIHDAKYIEDCKLVYVHDKGFGFEPHGQAYEKVVAALEGHCGDTVHWPRHNLFFGGVHAAVRHADGKFEAAGDPRRGGSVRIVEG